MAIINMVDEFRLNALRQEVFKLIEAVDDGYHKSYEGAMTLSIEFPNYFESERGYVDADIDRWCLELHCYLLINGRHKRYEGKTLSECLDKLEQDVKRWKKIEGANE